MSDDQQESIVDSHDDGASVDSPISATTRWWQTFCGPRSTDRGARARLRRCRSTSEAIRERAAISLAQWTGQINDGDSGPSDRALRTIDLARVLAHVKQDDPGRPLMRAAGWKVFPGDRKESDVEPEFRPVLSEIRFRRLLTSEDGEALVRAFVRLVALLGHTASVDALRKDFLDWGDPSRREVLRQRWAFDYYSASSARPTDRTPITPVEAHAS